MSFLTMQDLVNLRIAAFGDNEYRQGLLKAEAYYDNRPDEYASYAQRGVPRSKWPRATVPIAREIIDRSASMLFGNAPGIHCASNPALAQWLNHVLYTDNAGQSLLLLLARCGGKLGSVAVRYAIDPKAEKPVRFLYYSPFEYEVITDDEDREKIIGVITEIRRRSQIEPWRYLRFRELWTAKEHIRYRPLEESMALEAIPPRNWEIESVEENPYQEIPFQIILNRRTDTDPMAGLSDLYGLYDLIDRLNIALDDWSQLCGVTARPVLFGKQLTQDSLEVEPGDIITGNLEQSDLKPIEMNPAYEVIQNYIERIEALILRGAQGAQIDPSSIQGLGELSGRALRLLYAPLIQLTEEKKLTYGRGIEMLLESVARSAKRMGVDAPSQVHYSVDKVDNSTTNSVDALAEVDPRDPQTYDITLSYPDLFPSTPSDRESELRALELASQLGMPNERIIRELSRIYQMDDTEQFALESKQVK